jgi:hypothetical protein
MARVASLPNSRSYTSARAHLSSHVHLLLDLLPAALLLGLLRTWATELAPRHGWYFTAEAVLLAYAYLALFRSVKFCTPAENEDGFSNREWAQKAGVNFNIA